MTASGFRIARVSSMLGRTLVAADESPSAPAVAAYPFRFIDCACGDSRGGMPESFANRLRALASRVDPTLRVYDVMPLTGWEPMAGSSPNISRACLPC